MLEKLRIRHKIFLIGLAIAVPAVLLIGGLAYVDAKAAISKMTFAHLTSVRSSKASQLRFYFRQIRLQAQFLAEDLMVVEAMQKLEQAYRELDETDVPAETTAAVESFYKEIFFPRFNELDSEPTELGALLPRAAGAFHLQNLYIAANPHPVGEKDRLDTAGDGSKYSLAHQRYHPILRDFLEKFGYYDVFLIDMEGRIVYSVFKEIDFATSLLDGPHRDSNLALACKAAMAAEATDAAHLEDFARYPPSLNAAASFIATPIHAGDRRLGVLALQMPVGGINRVMTGSEGWVADGLGESGETYLVGPDFRMRSISRFILEDPEGYFATMSKTGAPSADVASMRNFRTSILLQEVRTEAAEAALEGTTGTAVIDDYRGVPVLSSFAPLDIEGLHWGVLSEIDAAEAFAPIRRFTLILAAGLLVVLLLVLLLSSMLSRRLVAPIVALEGGARRFAAGESNVEILVSGGDELGGLAKSFNRMIVAVRDQRETLEQVLDVAKRLARSSDLREILEQIVDRGLVILDSDKASILLLDKERGELYSEATSGRELIRFPATTGIAGDTLDKRQAIAINDCYADERFNPEVDRQTGYRTDSMISIPLIGAQGVTVGVMQLLNARKGFFSDDDLAVADMFAGFAALAIQRSQAVEDRVQRAKMEHDLDLARTIQMELLPKSLPQCSGYDIAAFTQPADETGGDIFDLLVVGGEADESLLILLADATGHGIGAAISVTQVRAMLRVAMRLDTGLDALSKHLNDQLVEDLPSSKFVTVFLGILDPSRNAIDYHSLGQAPLLYFDNASGKCRWLGSSAPPAGLVPLPMLNRPAPIEFGPGDIFVLLSDGFYEYANPAGEEMETERIGAVIEQHRSSSAEEILEALKVALDRFAEGAPQGDDLTAIVVKRAES